LLVSLFLTGCVPVKSVQPLSNEETSTFDKRLIGAWEEADRQKHEGTGVFWVGKKKGSKNALQLVVADLNNEDLTVRTLRATMFVRHGQNNYLSVDMASFMALFDQGKEGPQWVFCRYEMPNAKTVNVYGPKNEVFREAVRKGELKGKLLKPRPFWLFGFIPLTQPDGGDVVLEDSPERVLRFLDQKKCFDDTPTVYKKVQGVD
jgi:hypothetical protein